MQRLAHLPGVARRGNVAADGPYLVIHSCACVIVLATQLLSLPIMVFRIAGTSELNIVSVLSFPGFSSSAIACAFV